MARGFKDLNKNRNYMRDYMRNYSQKKSHKQYMKEYYEKQRQKIRELLGVNCVICGKNVGEKGHYHEIHGKKHGHNPNYIVTHYKDFVCLCFPCHTNIHRLTKEGINTEKAIELIRKMESFRKRKTTNKGEYIW